MKEILFVLVAATVLFMAGYITGQSNGSKTAYAQADLVDSFYRDAAESIIGSVKRCSEHKTTHSYQVNLNTLALPSIASKDNPGSITVSHSTFLSGFGSGERAKVEDYLKHHLERICPGQEITKEDAEDFSIIMLGEKK